MRTPVVAIAFRAPQAKIIATDNQNVLRSVKSICVLPFDGYSAASVVEALPEITVISDQLTKSKSLRQQRFEISDELTKRGFTVVDCVSVPSPSTPRLLVTSVEGGGFDNALSSFFWTLYSGDDHIVMIKGERELMGLARPAARSYPISSTDLAAQIRAVVDAAK